MKTAERQDGSGIQIGEEGKSEIFVMTPEACLMQISIDKGVFENLGLIVFDECHLLHPRDLTDRRAIDAMLCVLQLSKAAQNADFILMSAMMKNTDEIAEWVEELTKRPCLSLSLSWKPTRQLRGSVVYQLDETVELQNKLSSAKRKRKTAAPAVKIKRSLRIEPYALFSLKQTWETNNRDDYTLVKLLQNEVVLGASTYWKLVPNAIAVSSSIAGAAANSGIKSLVFFQSIRNAVSAANRISEQILFNPVKMTEEEENWHSIASNEFGSSSHLYLNTERGEVTDPATVHHGLLLPEERYLCESLYRRNDGIRALTATSTLAQGMNLPSELVIIGEDSRFNEAKDSREILEAHELLNAAGRAGRAGENASGIVLVVPGKVVGIDLDDLKIGAHWSDLRAIFGQSDQCLEIQDPISDILDRISSENDDHSEIDRYALLRMVSSSKDEPLSENLSKSIRSSFGAFQARKRSDEEWIKSRVEAAVSYIDSQPEVTERELALSQISASLGLPKTLVNRLANELKESGPNLSSQVLEWTEWLFDWLGQNPDLIEIVFKEENLSKLFGGSFRKLEDDKAKTKFAIPRIYKLTRIWMLGGPLSELELELGTHPEKLKKCDRARQFVIRIIPDLSYVFSLPALLIEWELKKNETSFAMPASVTRLGRCVRLGYHCHKLLAYSLIRTGMKLSRRQCHNEYSKIEDDISEGSGNETWDETLQRMRFEIINLKNRDGEG